jgi:cytochrome c peroxidase
MKRFVVFLFILCIVFVLGFVSKSSGPSVSKKDVELRIPKGFPEPVYNFANNKPNPAIFSLGRKLFYDPILSSDSSTSCQTCHQRSAAFAHIDHALSHGVNARIGTRNVPALQNLIWKRTYMWDGGVNNLEVQPINPITNPVEMNESLAHVILKLKQNKEYEVLFRQDYRYTIIN